MINVGIIWALLTLLYSVIIFTQSFTLKYYTVFGPGPGFFPLWISGILILVSILYLVDSSRKNVVRLKDILPEKTALKKMGSMTGGILFFILTADFLGFFLSGVIMLLTMFLWDFKIRRALLLSLLFMAILVVSFQILLKVMLPIGFIGRLLF